MEERWCKMVVEVKERLGKERFDLEVEVSKFVAAK